MNKEREKGGKVLLFKIFWLHRVLVAACGLFVVVCGLLSSCGTWGPECMGSVVAALGLSSCGTWA